MELETPKLTGRACLQLVEQLLAEKRAAFAGTLDATFVVSDEGPFVLEVGDSVRLAEGMREDVDLMVVCNAVTLSDLLLGKFDYGSPSAEHMWIWAGDEGAYKRLSAALSGAQSWMTSRIAAVSASRQNADKKKRRTTRNRR